MDGPRLVQVQFAGDRVHYLWLALKTTLWTVMTLGLYRFWMKTRQRRFLWSSIQPGGIPLEYHGHAWEKLLGFLAAVCFLAFYLGLVNLILVFASFSLFEGDTFGYWISFLGFVPLFWAAKYRARRYLLSRTSWRGIRFGVEPGAWAYAGNALWNWFLTIISLGYLWPRMTFQMEKFRIDRTTWGDQKFEQGGNWKMLRRHMRPIYLFVLLSVAFVGAIWLSDPREMVEALILRNAANPMVPLIVLLATLTYIGLLALVFSIFRTNCLRTMANHKRLGGDVRMVSFARPWRIIRHYFWGSVLLMLTLFAVFFVLGLIFAGVIGSNPGLLLLFEKAQVANLSGLELWTALGLGLLAYFSLFVLMTVLTQFFITFPNLRHYAETLGFDENDFAHVRQRPADDLSNAEGFADALDLGAAF